MKLEQYHQIYFLIIYECIIHKAQIWCGLKERKVKIFRIKWLFFIVFARSPPLF